ncbi:MAG TPA: enoyl-CoA hydratase-related protein, partial [Candidatus Acidoferrales bacterium]|nr:enoyl-CoA hydratase-related protein [Candidatus Acidoferrales bacterium]
MNAAGAPPVRLELADGVAVATLDRPGKLNAFAGDMRERLVEVVRTVGANPDARVLVVTGAGRAFCSGGDVDFMRDLLARGAGYDELAPQVDAGREVVTALAALPIPVIAALNGVAAGAGANLALACDVRLASDEARFGETFVRIGLHPDWGGSWTLPRVVGLAKALDLCWSGEVIGADEMLRLGIVQRLWPAAAFEPEWRAYAARLAAGPRTSLRAIKASLRASAERTLAQALDAEAGAQRACWESGDAAEGLGAFREKREPRFVSAAAAR